MQAIRELMARAVQHHKAGRFAEAEHIYRDVLKADPLQPDALHLIGLVEHQTGRNDAAIDHIRRAVELRPASDVFLDNLGIVCTATGRSDEAIACHRRALALNPHSSSAHTNLGQAYMSQGQLPLAVDCIQRALKIDPSNAKAHNSLGVVLKRQGKVDEAIGRYRRALEIDPAFAQAHNNLGNALTDQGKFAEATAAFGKALRIQPNFADAHNNLGRALLEQDKFDEAQQRFRRALELNPAYAAAHNNLGLVLLKHGELDEAEACCRRALQIDPRYSHALNNLGNVLRDQGKIEEATDCYERALEVDPRFLNASLNLGHVQQLRGNMNAAVAVYQAALQLQPDNAQAQTHLGSVFQKSHRLEEARTCYERAAQCDPSLAETFNGLGDVLKNQGDYDGAKENYRRALELRPDETAGRLRHALLCPAVYPSIDAMAQYRRRFEDELERFESREWQMDFTSAPVCSFPYNLQFHEVDLRPLKEMYARLLGGRVPDEPARPGQGRPQVAMLVTRGHEVGFLRALGGVLDRMNLAKFAVTVVCAASGAARIRGRLTREEIQLMPVAGRFDRIVDQVKQRRFDVVYHWEIGTDPDNYFFPFFRLAPVQCTGWGLPMTSGIDRVDYYLSEKFVEPAAAQTHYTEKLLLADTLLTWLQRSRPSGPARNREDFGLAARQHVYLCAQKLEKLHPDFDDTLADILRRDPAGVVTFIEDRYVHKADALRRRMARTIADVFDRVVFVPRVEWDDYLRLVACADVLLDPPHYGGAITTFDAFSLSQPIVTCPSPFRSGRFTGGCYRKMGIEECVAADMGDYVNIAVRLGTDAEYRRSVVAQIEQASDVLFEDQQAVREYERIFLELVEAARSRAVA